MRCCPQRHLGKAINIEEQWGRCIERGNPTLVGLLGSGGTGALDSVADRAGCVPVETVSTGVE